MDQEVHESEEKVNLSFTGPRHGMSDSQKVAFVRFLIASDVRSFSHGCCIGSDIEAHYIVRQIFGRAVRILV